MVNTGYESFPLRWLPVVMAECPPAKHPLLKKPEGASIPRAANSLARTCRGYAITSYIAANDSAWRTAISMLSKTRTPVVPFSEIVVGTYKYFERAKEADKQVGDISVDDSGQVGP